MVEGRKQKSAPDAGFMSAIELRERGRWTRIRDSRARKKGGNDPNRDRKSDVRVRRGGYQEGACRCEKGRARWLWGDKAGGLTSSSPLLRSRISRSQSSSSPS